MKYTIYDENVSQMVYSPFYSCCFGTRFEFGAGSFWVKLCLEGHTGDSIFIIPLLLSVRLQHILTVQINLICSFNVTI